MEAWWANSGHKCECQVPPPGTYDREQATPNGCNRNIVAAIGAREHGTGRYHPLARLSAGVPRGAIRSNLLGPRIVFMAGVCVAVFSVAVSMSAVSIQTMIVGAVRRNSDGCGRFNHPFDSLGVSITCGSCLVRVRFSQIALLQSHELGVKAAPANELAVRAGLDDLTLVQHDDSVSADDARKPMRDNQRGATRHQAVQRFLNRGLVLGINAGERLVIAPESASPSTMLGQWRLAGAGRRETRAALSHNGLVTIRQRANEFMRIGEARRGLDLFLRCFGFTQPEVLRHGAVKEVRVLRHDRDVPSDLSQSYLAQIPSPETNPPDWGSTNRSSSQTSVDLPAPLGPTTPNVSPAFNVKETPFKAGRAPP